MVYDSAHFRNRAAQARCSAFNKGDGEDGEVAGHLALALAALARRRASVMLSEAPSDPVIADAPLMLRY